MTNHILLEVGKAQVAQTHNARSYYYFFKLNNSLQFENCLDYMYY